MNGCNQNLCRRRYHVRCIYNRHFMTIFYHFLASKISSKYTDTQRTVSCQEIWTTLKQSRFRLVLLLVFSNTTLIVIPDVVMIVGYDTPWFSVLTEISYIADVFIFNLMDPALRNMLRRKKEIYVSHREIRRRKIAVVSHQKE